MQLKYHYLIFGLILFQYSASGQKSTQIEVDWQHALISINGTKFDIHSTRADYRKVLGPADTVVQLAGKDKFLIYDKLGFALALKSGTDLVQIITLSYMYESMPGYRKFAEEKFTGKLSISNTVIGDHTGCEVIEKATGAPAIAGKDHCMIKGNGIITSISYRGEPVHDISFQFFE